MKISTECLYLLKNFTFEKSMDILSDAGFDCVDFSFFYKSQEENMKNPQMISDEEAYNLRKYVEGKNMSFNQAHAPFPTSFGDDRDEKCFDIIVRSMELASILGVKLIVVHPKHHMKYKYNEKTLFEINYNFYKSLLPFCKKYNIKVGIENMWQMDDNLNHIVPSVCANAEELAGLIDSLDPNWFAACVDIGHCSLVGENAAHMIKTLGKRLKALHMHDTDFVNDCHALPGLGKINYSEIIDALAEIGYDGEFTLEANEFLGAFEPEFMPEAAKFMASRVRKLASDFEKRACLIKQNNII